MAETTGKARTTILTLMEQLRQKKYLKRRKVGGLYRYSPTASSTDVVRGLVKDFVETCRDSGISIERAIPLTRSGDAMALPATGRLANLLAEQALFVLRRPD